MTSFACNRHFIKIFWKPNGQLLLGRQMAEIQEIIVLQLFSFEISMQSFISGAKGGRFPHINALKVGRWLLMLVRHAMAPMKYNIILFLRF